MARTAKSPEDLKRDFDAWKAKKGAVLLKHYQTQARMKSADPDYSAVSAKIREIEDEIARKHEQLDKRLAVFYARAYRASGSAEARAERAARTHKLCQLGGLVEKAGLGTMTPAALLGMLLQQREYMQKSPSVLSRWQADGERALAARPTEQER